MPKFLKQQKQKPIVNFKNKISYSGLKINVLHEKVILTFKLLLFCLHLGKKWFCNFKGMKFNLKGNHFKVFCLQGSKTNIIKGLDPFTSRWWKFGPSRIFVFNLWRHKILNQETFSLNCTLLKLPCHLYLKWRLNEQLKCWANLFMSNIDF